MINIILWVFLIGDVIGAGDAAKAFSEGYKEAIGDK
jgi:hypothetical protein